MIDFSQAKGASYNHLIGKEAIDNMVWSYTRLSAFERCPYSFWVHYIVGQKDDDRFYSTYGRFMHSLLERFYNGTASRDKLVAEYYRNFNKEVRGYRPKPSICEKYYEQGADFLKDIEPLPWKKVSTEQRVSFTLDGNPFVGVIDYLGTDDDNKLVLVDHKSRLLKQKSKRAKPTKNDQEIDEMCKQLYLYAYAVKEQYGELPVKLVLNCFRSRELIEIPFDNDAYKAALQWAVDTIDKIKNTEFFEANDSMFWCTQICGLSNYCSPLQIVMLEKSGIDEQYRRAE